MKTPSHKITVSLPDETHQAIKECSATLSLIPSKLMGILAGALAEQWRKEASLSFHVELVCRKTNHLNVKDIKALS